MLLLRLYNREVTFLFGYVTVNRANSNDPGVDNYQKTLNIVHKYVILF